MKPNKLFAVIVGAVSFGLLPCATHAATRHVWPDSPTPGAPFDQWDHAAHDIQTAVDAASPGDTVLVTNGVYATGGAVTPGYALSNRVVLSKPITLQSVNGRDVTIIQGQGPLGPDAVRCLYMTNGVTVIGFTLTNGFTLTTGHDYYDRRGAGTFMDGGGVVSNCVVIANTAHNMGGGIFANYGGNVFDSLIKQNQALSYAGGIYCMASNGVVQRCQILGNWANYVGGMRLYYSALAIDCEIRDNWATNRTGGVSLEQGGILSGSTVASNTAISGYGGGVWLNAASVLRDSHVWGNSASSASSFGGGVYGSGANTFVVTNCDFLWNQAGAGGAAAYCTLVNCDVRTNHSTYAALCNGAAIGTTFTGNSGYWGGAANGCALTNCTLLNNVATGGGGGIAGGTLDGCTLIGNFSTNNGGGVYRVSVFNSMIISNTALLSGGGIWNSFATNVVVTNTQVIGNQAGTDGGGIHMDNGGLVLNSLIASNQSLNYGGGLSLQINGLVANCRILGNAANSGGGSWNYGAAYAGGGVWSVDASGVVSNCVVSGCLAGGRGGGIYQGTVFKCQLTSNSTGNAGVWGSGGGAYFSQVHDSTLAGNVASSSGGGMTGGSLDHCIVSGNSAPEGAGLYSNFQATNCLLAANVGQYAAYQGAFVNCTVVGNSNAACGVNYSTLANTIVSGFAIYDTLACQARFSCARELAAGVDGNTTNEPAFVNPSAGDYSLNFLSPGLNTGTNFDWMTKATDLAGNPRLLDERVDMGAYEYDFLQATGAVSAGLSADYTNVATSGKVRLTAAVAGRATGCVWQWDDGTSVSNVLGISRTFNTVGAHTVAFIVWNLSVTNHFEFTVVVVPPATRYVAVAGANTPPYTNWASAATNIQSAIDAALLGDFVLVASGVYSNGGAFAAGASNRVALNKTPLTVSSVSGPAETIILADGGRGAFVGDGTLLAGFTITHGSASTGGGVWCDGSGTVSNCTLIGNQAGNGGGVFGGTLWRCTLSQNTTLTDTESGGGQGGGALEAALYDCLVVSNSAYGGWGKESDPGFGGGVSGGRLVNCTVTRNQVDWIEGYGIGSGSYGSLLTNCIVYDNTGADNDVEGGAANFTCMASLSVPGMGNLTNAPLFVNAAVGDFGLASGSPCINVGTNLDWMIGALDLAGQPRLVGGTVDMGAFEFQRGGGSIGFSTLTAPLRLDLKWPSVIGTSYQLQSATTLPAASWLDEGAPFGGTGDVLTTNVLIGTDAKKFFRLRLLNN